MNKVYEYMKTWKPLKRTWFNRLVIAPIVLMIFPILAILEVVLVRFPLAILCLLVETVKTIVTLIMEVFQEIVSIGTPFKSGIRFIAGKTNKEIK